jgi:hypothetical protein
VRREVLNEDERVARSFDFCRGGCEVLKDDKRASRASQRALRSSNCVGSKEAFTSSTEALSRSKEVLNEHERPRRSSRVLFDDVERVAGMSSKERLRSFHFDTGTREVLDEEQRDLKCSNVGRG